jgi:hypothetical protein
LRRTVEQTQSVRFRWQLAATQSRTTLLLRKIAAPVLDHNEPGAKKKGKMETWYLISNLNLRAKQMAREYGHQFCCEEGFRDAKWYLGFAESRVEKIAAWSRLFTLFAIALLVLTVLGTKLLIRGGPQSATLLRRVASRRSERCELSLIAAVIALVQQDRSLLAALSPFTKLNLEATLSNVS